MFTLPEALSSVRDSRRDGKTVVFTHGVFDLLRPDVVRHLRKARGLGDVLVVGVEADASVRARQGPGRPITPEAERAEVIAAVESVDVVVVCDAAVLHGVIAALQPDVLVESVDAVGDAAPGRDPIEARVLELRRSTAETDAAAHDVENRRDGKDERQDH
jgi:D-beta-D-heptose 7-phosphate kinase/D-beta-D-heptose 1-phosphate adenosyltransferase